MSNLILSMMLNSGLAQYPDRKLYNAAVMLDPADRPSVPVRVQDDNWRAREGVKASFFDIGKYNPDPFRKIVVQQQSKPYKDFDKRPQRLAAVLAHEAMHDRGFNEADGYAKERDTLQKFGEKDGELMRLLSERSDYERKSEEKAGTVARKQ